MKKFWKNLLGLARKLRSKEATWSKNENSVKPKTVCYINFLKKDYLLLWPMVNFRLKATQNWDLWSEIQGFEAFEGAQPRLSNPWIMYDKYQFWAIFRRKSTIGHKSKWFSFKKLIYRFFFRLTEFSFFDQAASFDLNFLARPNRFFQNIITGSLVYHVDAKNQIVFIW